MRARGIAAGSMAGVAVAGIVAGTTTLAQAAARDELDTFPIGGFRAPVKVIDVAGWSTEDRGRVHLWALRRTGDVRNQRWTPVHSGEVNGHTLFKFVNEYSGKCLDKSEDAPNGNGNVVYQHTCHNGPNQLWERIPFNDSSYTQLKNLAGGRCLDVEGPTWQDGTTIHVWDCYSVNGEPAQSQRWNITEGG
ncbi:RICIN domain-containing protein [Actinomadura terrae]|uniref:RICIN domain-containing protein n=1 Tax=Actinomadura terrae TaxID=604353 RepID=UPI001FA6F62E|nr:RICIN domain-containing protein [Actinomadura terrae]